jgi:hypothetical protein
MNIPKTLAALLNNAVFHLQVCFCLDAWQLGHFKPSKAFTEVDYEGTYCRDNMQWLEDWVALDPEATRIVRQDVYKRLL